MAEKHSIAVSLIMIINHRNGKASYCYLTPNSTTAKWIDLKQNLIPFFFKKKEQNNVFREVIFFSWTEEW